MTLIVDLETTLFRLAPWVAVENPLSQERGQAHRIEVGAKKKNIGVNFIV